MKTVKRSENFRPPVAKMILILSTNLKALRNIRANLTAQGFSVMTASTIEEAIQISKRTSLGLMICDMGSMAELTEKLPMLIKLNS